MDLPDGVGCVGSDGDGRGEDQMSLRSRPERFRVVGVVALMVARVSAKRVVSLSKVPWRGVMLARPLGMAVLVS